jgi:hypothetical protein
MWGLKVDARYGTVLREANTPNPGCKAPIEKNEPKKPGRATPVNTICRFWTGCKTKLLL